MKTLVFTWHKITVLKVLVTTTLFFTKPLIGQSSALLAPTQGIEKKPEIATSTYSFLNPVFNPSEKSLNSNKILNFKKEISLVFFIVLIGIVTLMIVSIKKRRSGKVKEINTIQNTDLDILQNEIRAKENSLSAKLIIQEKKIKELTRYNYQLFNAIENNVPKNLNDLKEGINQLDSDLKLDNILEKIPDEHKAISHNGLLYILKQRHPKLSKTDLKHCLFLHMQLSLKKTAELLHVTIATVKSGRHRAKSKIDLPPHIGFKEYMNRISKEYDAIKLDHID